MRRYMCGTPAEKCSGGTVLVSSRLGTGQRAHSSPPEAFQCYKRYLISVGYVAVGARELRIPQEFRQEGMGNVLVLPKQSHFGGELRTGKAGDKSKSKRFMPCKGRPGIIF